MTIRAPVYAHVSAGGNTSCPDNAFTQLVLDVVGVQSPSNPYSTANKNYTAPRAGLLIVTAWMGVPSASYSQLLISLYKGGSEVLRGPQWQNTATLTIMWYAAQYKAAAGEVFDLRTFQTSGATRLFNPAYAQFMLI